jgi:hypothetical protein
VSGEPRLDDKIVLLHQALQRAGIPHAFGGALALAYWSEPRATHDVDCNLFAGIESVGEVAAALHALDVAIDTDPLGRVAEQGQARVWWGRTPLDLFFAYDAVHDAFAAGAVIRPFGEVDIPVLSAEALAVCKVVFDRPKDWVDLDALLFVMGPELDLAEIDRWTAHLLPAGDDRLRRFADLVTEHCLR